MSERNKLFRKSMEILSSEGVEPELAKRMVNEALAEARLVSSQRTANKCMWTNYGTMLEDENGCMETPADMCKKRNITCDSSAKFRYF